MDLNFTSTRNTDRRRKMAEMFTKPTAVGLLLSRPSPTRLNIQDLESFRTMREAGKGAAGSGPYCTYLWIALTQYCTDTALHWTNCTNTVLHSSKVPIAQSEEHCFCIALKVQSEIVAEMAAESNLRWWKSGRVHKRLLPFNPIKTHPGHHKIALNKIKN